MIPSTAQIAEQLDDLVTHAGAWTRVLRERADRPGTPSQIADRMQGAASEIDGATRAFRWRADRAETDPLDLIRTADRALAQAPVLRGVLELERDAVMTASPDEASWFAHELTALERLQAARRDMIYLPPPGETPSAELTALKAFSGLLGRELIADFESADGAEPSIDVTLGLGQGEISEQVHLEAAARVARLADRLIRCEIPNWDEPPGASGRVRIFAKEDPWLDGVDHAEDWLLERTIDLEALDEMGWAENEAAPEP